MTHITWNKNEFQYMSVFRKVTKTEVKDCIETSDKLVFIVARGQIGAAIGKKGENVKRLHELLKKNLDIIEYSEDREKFLRNIFHNFKIKGIIIEERGNRTHATVSVESKDKGKVIGKDGRNLKLAKDILVRHTDINSLSID